MDDTLEGIWQWHSLKSPTTKDPKSHEGNAYNLKTFVPFVVHAFLFHRQTEQLPVIFGSCPSSSRSVSMRPGGWPPHCLCVHAYGNLPALPVAG